MSKSKFESFNLHQKSLWIRIKFFETSNRSRRFFFFLLNYWGLLRKYFIFFKLQSENIQLYKKYYKILNSSLMKFFDTSYFFNFFWFFFVTLKLWNGILLFFAKASISLKKWFHKIYWFMTKLFNMFKFYSYLLICKIKIQKIDFKSQSLNQKIFYIIKSHYLK